MDLTEQKDYTAKRAAAVAVLFIGAAAARIFWVNQVRAQWGDDLFYTWMSGSHAPLLPAFAGSVARAFASIGLASRLSLELSTVLIYVLFGGLLVAPVYGITRRMSSETVAAGASLAIVFYPTSLSNFPRAAAIVEPIYLLLVAAAWYFLLVSVDEMVLWPAAIGGLFVGLAYLARPEALIYLGFALGLLLVATWLSRKQNFSLRRAAANAGIALGTFALIAGPHLATVLQVRM